MSEREYPHSLAFRVHDLEVLVRSNDLRFLGEASRVFYDAVPTAKATPKIEFQAWVDRRLTSERKHVLFRSGEQEAVIVTAFYPAVLPAIERNVVNSLTAFCKDVVLLGAACLASRGVGFLLFDDDQNRQSQLARDLVRRGCSYYADRYTLVRRSDGRALPFAKGLTIERLRHPLLTRMRQEMPFRGVTMNTVTYTHPGAAAIESAVVPLEIHHAFEILESRGEQAEVVAMATQDIGRFVQRTDCGGRMDAATFDLVHRIVGQTTFHGLRPGHARDTVEAVLATLHGAG